MLFLMRRKAGEHRRCFEELSIYASEEKKQKKGKGMVTRATTCLLALCRRELIPSSTKQ